MCWRTREPIVLEKACSPFYVFKICRYHKDRIESYFMEHIYPLDEVQTNIITIDRTIYHPDNIVITEINVGFHSYSIDCMLYRYQDVLRLISLGGNREITAYYTHDIILVTCEIPAGACYYKNEFGEVVSNKIKAVKIEDLHKVGEHLTSYRNFMLYGDVLD